MMAPADPNVLEVSDLKVTMRRHGAPVRAVNGIDFRLRRGECLTVIGESGSGKSVMLRAIMGILPPNATVTGSVRFSVGAGQEVPAVSMPQSGRRSVAMVFQEPSTALDPVFTIGDQLIETLVSREPMSRAAARCRALELLEQVSIPSAARRLEAYPHEMSGGMRQRAVIALALACKPEVLLADEPTTSLDATVQIQLLLLLRRLQREMNMAIVFVTHDMGVAAEISDRICVMYAGSFVERGSAEEVLLDPRHPYTRGLLGSTVQSGMRGRTLSGIRGAPPDLSRDIVGCPFAPRCDFAIAECARVEPRMAGADGGHAVACLRANDIPAFIRPNAV